MRNLLKTSLFFTSLVTLNSSLALAVPMNGAVAEGSISIRQEDPKTTQVTQTSDRGVIDWQSFNVAADEKVNFTQPSVGSLTVNRINSVDASIIYGQITANGQIALINPNGIITTRGSKIDVAGLVATTVNVKSDDLLNGTLTSLKDGLNGHAQLINAGDIVINEAGHAMLISTDIVNTGNITANGGQVALAAADTFSVDLDRNSERDNQYIDLTGPAKEAKILNTGSLNANGGSVHLVINQTDHSLERTLITQNGIISAKSVSDVDLPENGVSIYNVNNVANPALNASTMINGTINVSGGTDFNAGDIDITGDSVSFQRKANLDASGKNGGNINVSTGSGYSMTTVNGQTDFTFDDLNTISSSKMIGLAAGSSIKAGGLNGGLGGSIDILSEGSIYRNKDAIIDTNGSIFLKALEEN